MMAYKYNHLSTKIRAMKGKMLKPDDYRQMASKTSVKEVAHYLKNATYYQNDLTSLDENDVHRGHLEILLYRALIRDALKIAGYLQGYEKKIYRYVFRQQEVEDIKKLIRLLHQGESLENMDRRILFISRHSKIDFNKVLGASNDVELVEALAGNNFYDILRPLIDQTGKLPLFESEMAMDVYYFGKIIRQIQLSKDKHSKELLKEMFGYIADYKNILFIYRSRHYYQLNKEMIYRYIIPLHYKLSSEQVNAMVEAPSVQMMINLVDKSFYGRIFSLSEKGVGLSFLRFMRQHWERLVVMQPFSIAPVLGYVYLKELEVADITSIIEGVRYQVGEEDVARNLIYPMQLKGGQHGS